MHELANKHRPADTRWYVMVHLNPQWVETMLHKESKGELLKVGERDSTPAPAPFEFFVPYQYMKPDTPNGLRGLFHRFVFIRASRERLNAILTSDWNTLSRLHLLHYRDKGGNPVMISNEEYEQLHATFLNSQLQVYFGLPVDPIDGMTVGDEVTLLLDDWKGKKGRIESIAFKKGRVAMTVSVNILGQTMSVHFRNLHDGDVLFSDHYAEELLTGNLIDNMEGQVAAALGRYFEKRAADKRRRDFPRINRFLSYADIRVDDENDLRRFTSLMLMCATMLGETDLCNRFRGRLQEWLGDKLDALQQADSEARAAMLDPIDAYMLIALFANTRDPRLRDAAKAYRKVHPDCPAIIGTFINKVRNAVTRKRGRKGGHRKARQ